MASGRRPFRKPTTSQVTRRPSRATTLAAIAHRNLSLHAAGLDQHALNGSHPA
jgi:hypothetical protein